jgi:hypothetical protein
VFLPGDAVEGAADIWNDSKIRNRCAYTAALAVERKTVDGKAFTHASRSPHPSRVSSRMLDYLIIDAKRAGSVTGGRSKLANASGINDFEKRTGGSTVQEAVGEKPKSTYSCPRNSAPVAKGAPNR